MAQWATVEDVKNLTGKVITEVERNQAVATLELHIGLIEAVERPGLTGRDRYWLKLALCYQAAWASGRPDLFERDDVDSASQDGESANFRPDAHTLAPLARKAIKRLSWRGPRTLNTLRSGAARVDVTSEAYDDSLNWRPM